MVTIALLIGAGSGILPVTTLGSTSGAGSNGGTKSVDQRSPFAALLSIDFIHHIPGSLGTFEEILHILPKVIAPYPGDGIRHDRYVAKENEDTKGGLLKSSNVAQIDRIQTRVSHGTCTKEDGVDIAKPEESFGITTIAIDAAAVHDD